jgi:GT2 family glycosyltransferase
MRDRRRAAKPPQVTSAAAIINWNSGHWLRSCIESLLVCSTELEIVVVDNASDDDSLEHALGFHDRVDFIRNSNNRGLAAAVNQAFAATATPYVLVLNPDVYVTPGATEYLEQWMESHAKAGAIGGYVNDKYLPRRLPTTSSIVRENLGVSVRPARPPGEDPIEVDQPAGAALMIRREAYDSIGGFDEQFHPAWYEDVDFCRRLKNAGWSLYFAPHARFVHEGGYSAAALGDVGFAAAYYRNQLRYARKHLGGAAAMAVRGSMAAGMIARLLRRPAKARAYWEVLTGALGGW